MSRLYAALSAALVIGGVVALVFQAWVLGAVLLLIGFGGLLAEIREQRKPGYIPMSSRNADSDGHDALKGQVLSVEQVRGGQSWIGGSTG